jgi:pantoate--beta-alanine ligase
VLICTDIPTLRKTIFAWKSSGERIAFVPTMGNLHAGHLQLVQAARQQAQRVVVSIFVNPLQFNEAADFNAYPRTLEQDAQQLRDVKTDVLFAPDVSVMYPQGQTANTKVMVPGLGDILEGEHRPGHFTGVTTVVAKLFNMVQPDMAMFGEKDFQQLMLIRRMVADLDMPIEICSLPTVREADGLAMSSRNGRLNPEERGRAPAIHETLSGVVARIRQGGRDYASLEREAMARLDGRGFNTEYVAVRRAADLHVPTPADRELVVLVASRLGQVRLIDNIPFIIAG